MFGLVLGSGLRGCGQPGLPWVLPRIKLTHEAGSNWKSCTLRCDRCGRFRLRAPGGSAFSARRDTELCSQQAQKIYPRHQYSENEVAVETYVIWSKRGRFFFHNRKRSGSSSSRGTVGCHSFYRSRNSPIRLSGTRACQWDTQCVGILFPTRFECVQKDCFGTQHTSARRRISARNPLLDAQETILHGHVAEIREIQ